MERKIARHLLEFLDLQVETAPAHEQLVTEFADTIRERCGKPLYPKPAESLAVSIMTPKTAALAFDRVYRVPILLDPVPEELGFYCATVTEMVFWAGGLLALTAREMGLAEERIERYFAKKLTTQEKAQNEIRTLRLLCSDF